jgi:polyisoprenoid-binding protein YceI
MHQSPTPHLRQRPRSVITASTRPVPQCGSPPGICSASGRSRARLSLRAADFSVTEPSSATVQAVLDAASFDTGNPRRDTDVRSAKYLDVTAYPDITFNSQQVRLHEGKWVAVGTLTAHGVAAPVDLTLDELRRDDGKLILRASAKIDRYAHQVTAGKGLAARWLTVEVTAIARRDSIDA